MALRITELLKSKERITVSFLTLGRELSPNALYIPYM